MHPLVFTGLQRSTCIRVVFGLCVAARRANHLKRFDHHLCRIAVLSVASPLTRAKTSIYIDARFFHQEVPRDLCMSPEEHEPVPLCRLFHVAGRSVLVIVGRRKPAVGHDTGAQLFDLWVSTQMTGEGYAIYHGLLLV